MYLDNFFINWYICYYMYMIYQKKNCCIIEIINILLYLSEYVLYNYDFIQVKTQINYPLLLITISI